MYLDFHRSAARTAKGGTAMSERFTDRAQRVIDLAQEEARTLGHNYVGTEHLLLGLIDEGEGVAATTLESLGIGLEAVRQQVAEIIGQSQQTPARRIPFTPRAKKALELSRREALALGHSHVGTEHILLGLLREGDGVAAQVLVGLGADLNGVRQQTIRVLTGRLGQGARRPGRPGRRDRGLLPEIMERVESIDSQVSAIGQRVGAGPDVSDLDQQIARARRGKEAAAGDEDFEGAAELRDRERQLLAEKAGRQQEWAAGHLDLASLAGELHRLGEEVGLLRDLLRQQGLGPHDSAA
jgi:Clp amino terminal domain, pathogenicity island component/UvrB/uvrC motif